jgi:hypothetical protein
LTTGTKYREWARCLAWKPWAYRLLIIAAAGGYQLWWLCSAVIRVCLPAGSADA